MANYNEEEYNKLISELFCRIPSFQQVGQSAYKPGIEGMEFMDKLLGHPHNQYKTIHIAGTNGKGSTSNMLASVLSASGLKVGLYTSPHILDFRERMRINSEPISKQAVWDFIQTWSETFDHLKLSFFEVTTAMALDWFAKEKVDIAIIETGLGGRLDSTNIISPILSIITNIGLDHCDLLGDTLGEIAFEKAGIIKEKTPVIIGENHPETDPIFERKTLYSNLSQADFFSDRTRAMSLLTFAEKTYPQLWDDHKEIMSEMDLQGEYQKKNLRTSLVAIEKLQEIGVLNTNTEQIKDAIIHTAARMDFHGRWEKLLQDPYTICDIGHNEHGLKYNFAQLSKMLDKGEVSSLTIIYGSVADKDINSVLDLMPKNAFYVFTQANSRRALSAKTIQEKFLNHHSDFPENQTKAFEDVEEAVRFAIEKAKEDKQRPMIYIGGSTYIVSEASEYILNTK